MSRPPGIVLARGFSSQPQTSAALSGACRGNRAAALPRSPVVCSNIHAKTAC